MNKGTVASTSLSTRLDLAHHIAKIIRVISVPPVMVVALIALLSVFRPDVIPHFSQSLSAVIFLAVIPALAYPLSMIIPSVHEKGRNGQRNLAIYLSVVGYVGGCIYALLSSTGKHLTMIFITYLLSVVILLILNKGFRIKASGHACSLTGPIALMCYYLGAWWIAVGVILYALILWASLKTKRHTIREFLWGSFSCMSAWSLVMLVGAFL